MRSRKIRRYDSIDHACNCLKAKVLVQGSYTKGKLKINVVKLQSLIDPAICHYISKVGAIWVQGASTEGIISLYKKW